MKYDIKQSIDGEWTKAPRSFLRACCDCGLVHQEQYRVQRGKLHRRVIRDRKETRAERKRIDLHGGVQMAIFAALGCTEINYKSPGGLDAAASQIADFVLAHLEEDGH
jgi:hypothetical protein